jgi:hypothetical protein
MSYIIFSNLSLTGDCSLGSTGEFYVEVTGDSPNWIVTGYNTTTGGPLPTSALTTSSNIYYVDNLTYGLYSLYVTDTAVPPATPVQYFYPFMISSGTSAYALVQDTTCNLNNGVITGFTQDDVSTNVTTTDFYLYDVGGTFISSGQSSYSNTLLNFDNFYEFNNLSPGSYYIEAFNAGCSGISASVVVKSSTTFTFGYYTVNDASCIPGQGSGKIFITGLTNPISAYTINWLSNVNGQTGSTITGLTQASYTVEITSPDGCVETQTIPIYNIPPVGQAAIYITQPSCFQNNGIVQLLVSGGTAPYYYYGSNGQSEISFDSDYTFTGLSSGLYTFTVTDAGFCTFTTQATLVTPNAFGSINISTADSTCNSNSGVVSISINNAIGIGNYTYTISGNTGSSTQTINAGLSHSFTNLSSGTYLVTVSNSSDCVYSETVQIQNTNKFLINTTISGTTCGGKYGSLSAFVTNTASFPVTYTLTGPSNNLQSITQPNGNFTNLASGNYLLTVTDSVGCSQSTPIFIAPSQAMDFTLYGVNPVFGNDGEIQVIITSGSPPFTFNWSANVGGQTGTYITGLTSGSYSLLITDKSGCTKYQTVKLSGTELLGTYSTTTICSNNFENSSIIGKRGIKQMFNEGYFDLTSGDTNCILNSATFKLVVKVGEDEVENIFYTSTALNDYPSDILWGDTMRDLILSFYGVGEVTIDYQNNTVKITNDCEEIQKNCGKQNYNLLNDTRFVVNTIITYDISCVSCN